LRTQVKKIYPIDSELKRNLMHWGSAHEQCIWLDSNTYHERYGNFQALLAVDALTSIKTDSDRAFEKLKEYQTLTKDWLFGYLSYDLKNDVEPLTSSNFDGLGFPDLYFFQPKKLVLLYDETIEFQYLNMVADEIEADWEHIITSTLPGKETVESRETIKIHLRTSKDSYFEKVKAMLHHIDQGNIYEANFCQEFFSEVVQIDPLATYWHLNSISKPPFATFLKMGPWFALSASPERYVKKMGNVVISQPIKGTAKRSKDPAEDQHMIKALMSDPKERSENIMITDLVRNDLSKIAQKGTVVVDELCKVYTFEQVHQLISTIRCEIKAEVTAVDILKETFPMGSMTGAPKISAMKIIEELEDAKRGLYSGTIGYFTPDNDFDFNVVIRSILYNEKRKYVSFSVGGAITANSIPEMEYEECLIKAKAMREALEETFE
jgi:para-aminobenzoate synthetase component 1